MNSLFQPLWYYPAKHLYKLLTNSDYRQFAIFNSRYAGCERFKKKIIKSPWGTFASSDVASFLSAYEEIFVNKIYMFKYEDEKNINILDFGANIGLSVSFFLQTYPHANIAAYEADQTIYDVLCQNIDVEKFPNVQLYNKAVWNENTTLNFFSEGADGGHIQSEGEKQNIKVQAIDVVDILKKYETIDFLKIDIEGAERYVIPRAKDQLYKVKNIFVEYHSEANQRQALREIIDVLDATGFRTYLQSEFVSPQPFVKDVRNAGFDLQINIFGKR